MKIKIKNYYALICDCSDYGEKDFLVCGIYASKDEAKKVKEEIKDCPARHKIIKINATIEIK